jgi:hypothetical protein
VTPVTVKIGGVTAEVVSVGAAPNEVGRLQLNVRVPAGTVTGDAVPVVLTVGEATSPEGVTLAIAPFSLSNPRGIILDDFGNLYIADTGAQVIRKLTSSGSITTIAGTGMAGYSGDGGPATSATFRAPFGLTLDGTGSLYITDLGNTAVRKISPDGIISTGAGTGQGGYSGDGGPATSAQLSTLAYTVDSSGNLYIADELNDRIQTLFQRHRQ